VPEKNFENRSIFGGDNGQKFAAYFLGHHVHVNRGPNCVLLVSLQVMCDVH